MKAISNAIKGVTYHNPQLGESLYELCRRATSRHIAGPDEILNQQVVYMINSEMHTPYAAKDACTCLKRRLQMDHPQKQYLAIILTSKVLQECHAAIGIHQGELLQEVAYILRTCRSSGPASARTRQVAMDVLRHFGSGGVDAYRQARQQGGPPAGTRMESVNRDPAAVAAERASLLDEIKRMCEQAGASTEILNELILNKEQAGANGGTVATAADGGDSLGLRKELLADVAELRKLFDLYMEQLASLTGPDAEQAMKEALEAVDMLDNALTLEKDVDAELKDLKEKGELPAAPAPGESSNAAAAAAAAAADTATAKMKSMNLIDLDDDAPLAAASAAGAAADPFAPPAAATAGHVDPFAPPVQSPPAAALDPFAPVSAAGAADPFAPTAAPAVADPFAVLAVAPTGEQPYPAQTAAAATAADPFAEPAPWGALAGGTPPAAAGVGLPMQLQAPSSAGGASAVSAGGASASSIPLGGSAGVSGGGAPASAAPAAVVSPTGMSAGGYMPQATGLGPYGAPGTPGYSVMPMQGLPAAYGYGMQPMQQVPNPYGMSPYGMPAASPVYSPQVSGNPYGQPAAGPYPGMAAPYPSPYAQQQPQQQMQIPPMPQQQQQPAIGGFAAPPSSLAAVQSPPASDAAGALSPTNPFATVAPAPAAGGVPNPFGNVSAGGATANVDQEWNTFFSDNRTGVQAAK